MGLNCLYSRQVLTNDASKINTMLAEPHEISLRDAPSDGGRDREIKMVVDPAIVGNIIDGGRKNWGRAIVLLEDAPTSEDGKSKTEKAVNVEVVIHVSVLPIPNSMSFTCYRLFHSRTDRALSNPNPFRISKTLMLSLPETNRQSPIPPLSGGSQTSEKKSSRSPPTRETTLIYHMTQMWRTGKSQMLPPKIQKLSRKM